jgi:hypothetical protein
LIEYDSHLENYVINFSHVLKLWPLSWLRLLNIRGFFFRFWVFSMSCWNDFILKWRSPLMLAPLCGGPVFELFVSHQRQVYFGFGVELASHLGPFFFDRIEICYEFCRRFSFSYLLKFQRWTLNIQFGCFFTLFHRILAFLW